MQEPAGKETGKLPGYSALAAKDELGHQLQQAGTVFALAQKQLEALHQQLAELDALCSGLLSGSSSIQSPLQEVQVATARTDQQLGHALKTSEHLHHLVAGIRREAVAEATGAYARENEILREELAEVKKVMITMVPVHSIAVPEDDDLELESVVPSERAEGPVNTGTRDKSMSCSSSALSCCVPVSLNDSSDLEWPEPLMDEFEMLSLRQGNPKLAPPRSWLPHLETSPSESDQALSPARARVPSLAAAALRLLLARWESPLQSFLYPSQTARLCLAARPPARRCLLDAALMELIAEEGTAEDVLAYFLNATQNYKGLSQLRTTDRPSESASDWPMVRAYRCMVKTVSSRFHRSPRLVVQFLRHLITSLGCLGYGLSVPGHLRQSLLMVFVQKLEGGRVGGFMLSGAADLWTFQKLALPTAMAGDDNNPEPIAATTTTAAAVAAKQYCSNPQTDHMLRRL
eukprot:s960_g9.t3